jgi:uncharacterized protein (TIGR02265 family)
VPTDPKDLERRIAATTPQDTVRGLTLNALFDAIEEHLGREAAVALDPARKGHRTEFFAYPVSDFLRISFAAADRMEKKLGGVDAVFDAFGYRTTANVLGSMVGATILALAGRNGLRALLGQAPTVYRSAVSYGERRVDWVGERHARFVFERDFLVPAYHVGVFRGALDAMGARAERLEGRATGPLSAVYDVAWSEAQKPARRSA